METESHHFEADACEALGQRRACLRWNAQDVGERRGSRRRSIRRAAAFGGSIWKCPYHDTCVQYGCPELCSCFCDSDDITYDGLHKNLVWRRTKTLGRGDDCCDFCIRVQKEKRT
ncbi:MAG: L-2-amino-thiazoline-4-carboxylic acid hydrolase [Christensenellales bacterium]